MAAPTVQVTVNASTIGGVEAAGARVVARLDQHDVWTGGVVIAKDVRATADEDGVAVLNLFPNNPTTGLGTTGSVYTFTITYPGGKTVKATAQIPNTNCNLQNVMDLDVEAGPSAAEVAQANAQAAALQAGGSATAAAGSATSAGNSATAAATSDAHAAGILAATQTARDTVQSLFNRIYLGAF